MRAALAALLLALPAAAEDGPVPLAELPLALDGDRYLVGGESWGGTPVALPFEVDVPPSAYALWSIPTVSGRIARLDVLSGGAPSERFVAVPIALGPSGGEVAVLEGVGTSPLVRSVMAADPRAEWTGIAAPDLGVPAVAAVGVYEDVSGNLVAMRILAFGADGAPEGVLVAGAVQVAAAGISRETMIDDLTETVTWRMVSSVELVER